MMAFYTTDGKREYVLHMMCEKMEELVILILSLCNINTYIHTTYMHRVQIHTNLYISSYSYMNASLYVQLYIIYLPINLCNNFTLSDFFLRVACCRVSSLVPSDGSNILSICLAYM